MESGKVAASLPLSESYRNRFGKAMDMNGT
jgi:hypothetical protein